MMKMNKRKCRVQQQSGKPVLVAFYLAQPRKDGSTGGSTSRATTSAHGVGHHHGHKHHLHGRGHDMRRGWSNGKLRSNRRADLLEYSRQLRAVAGQEATTAARSTPPPPAPPPRQEINTAAAVHGDEGQQLAAVNRLGRAMSQQQIRQRCFGDDGWSWKKALVLIFPFHSNCRRPASRRNDDDSEKNRNNNKKERWPAALLVGKRKLQQIISKSRRDHSGFTKTFMSIFHKRPHVR